ncbi:MAG: hypothetical protein Q7J09_01020 [Methanocalculus sp.]|nr:hypothetical protein [Methanocalculus sp.]MDO9538573.1 hypothetical protein [Methanocalculus sp.]
MKYNGARIPGLFIPDRLKERGQVPEGMSRWPGLTGYRSYWA